MKVIFCIPGSNFSSNFLQSWTALIKYCDDNSIKWLLSNKQSCNIYYVRNMCLGAYVMRGRNQKPFNSKISYDLTCWIDSDIVFTPQQFERLISYKEPIVSGIYLMQNGVDLACGKWDEEFFKKNSYMPFYTIKTIKDVKINNKGLAEVDFDGFGFKMVRYGVFEDLEYPWFEPLYFDIGNAHDFSMEDVSFAKKAQKKGYKILVDPNLRVLHKKTKLY